MNWKLPNDWSEFLHDDLERILFSKLQKRIVYEYENNTARIFPPLPMVFNAFQGIAPKNIRVVILGQDPYPSQGHAHGLAFSVQANVFPLPKSLKNIFKELQHDLNIELPVHGNLNRWRDQGVLLLNSALTVREGQPGSHQHFGWEAFSDAVIHRLSTELAHAVFLLWGASAQRKTSLINPHKHLILRAPHPSPLSAHRGFFGCGHFSKANEFLASKHLAPIAW